MKCQIHKLEFRRITYLTRSISPLRQAKKISSPWLDDAILDYVEFFSLKFFCLSERRNFQKITAFVTIWRIEMWRQQNSTRSANVRRLQERHFIWIWILMFSTFSCKTMTNKLHSFFFITIHQYLLINEIEESSYVR